MASLTNCTSGEVYTFCNIQELYDYLRYTIQMTSSEIVQLALDKHCKNFRLSVNTDLKQKGARFCVQLSGRVKQKNKLLEFWTSHPDASCFDFVIHLWHEHSNDLTTEDCENAGLRVVLRDDKQSNKELQSSLGLYNGDRPVVTLRDDPLNDPFDDINRIDSQLFGIGAAFSMAVLHQAVSGTIYSEFVRSRMDRLPLMFRSITNNERDENSLSMVLRPDYFPADCGNIFPTRHVYGDDCFFFGGLRAMRCVCLGFDTRKENLEKWFAYPSSKMKLINAFLKQKWLQCSRANKNLLYIRVYGSEKKTPFDSIPGASMLVAPYTPELLITKLARVHNVHVVQLPPQTYFKVLQ